MSAKHRRPPRFQVDWTGAVAAMFGDLPADWRAPAKVTLVLAAGHATWSARFVCPDGSATVARIRLARGAGPGVFVGEARP
jgi:hypothetical protein